MKTFLLTRFTLRELARKRLIAWAAAVSVLALVMFAIAMVTLYTSGNLGYGSGRQPYAAQMEMMAFYMVTFVASLLAILLSTSTIAGEIDNGTFLAVLPKPISRWEVIAGKLLAYAVVILVYVAVMAICLMAISYITTGIVSPLALPGIVFMALSIMPVLLLAVLGSTISTTIASAITVLMLYGFGWIGGLIELIGRELQNGTLVNIGTISNFILPGNKIWQYACYYLQPDVISGGSGPQIELNPFFGAVEPSFLMIVYVIAYLAVIGGAAAILFTRRDI